jgi:hypothetical protein
MVTHLHGDRQEGVMDVGQLVSSCKCRTLGVLWCYSGVTVVLHTYIHTHTYTYTCTHIHIHTQHSKYVRVL